MKKRRIPTIIGLLILIIGIAVSVFLINKSTHWFTRAAPEITPKQVKFTNITNNSFTVSWVTDEATSGFIKYGTTTKLDQVARDDRDEMRGETGNFITHHVTLQNLNPSTAYQFKIGSGGVSYDNNGQNYQVTTALRLTTPLPPSDVAYGTVNNQAGSPAEGAIVYLSLPGAISQSSLVKASGNWVIPLNLARSEDLSSYVQYDKQVTIEEILIQAGNQGTATAVATTKNDSPVPTITLGESHDFRTVAPPKEETEEEMSSSKFTFEEMGSPAPATLSSVEVTITNPHSEEEVNTQKPEIKGTGPAGKVLEITVESPAYSDTIVVSADGGWNWTPPANLEPGEHSITITYEDEEGQEETLSQTFVVLAAATSDLPALTATPSGTATPSPTASPTASPSPSASPSGRVSMPSTEAGVPDSGYLTPTFLIFIMGLVLITFGLFSNSLLKKKIF